MLELRDDLSFMRNLNPVKFRLAIEKETNLLRQFYSKELTDAA